MLEEEVEVLGTLSLLKVTPTESAICNANHTRATGGEAAGRSQRQAAFDRRRRPSSCSSAQICIQSKEAEAKRRVGSLSLRTGCFLVAFLSDVALCAMCARFLHILTSFFLMFVFLFPERSACMGVKSGPISWSTHVMIY